MQTLFLATALAVAPVARQDVRQLTGAWESATMTTAIGKAEIPGLYVFKFGAGWWTSETPEGNGKGKLVVRAGRLDLVSPAGNVPRTFTIDGDKLTLTLWPNDLARRRGGDALKAGAIVFKLTRG